MSVKHITHPVADCKKFLMTKIKLADFLMNYYLFPIISPISCLCACLDGLGRFWKRILDYIYNYVRLLLQNSYITTTVYVVRVGLCVKAMLKRKLNSINFDTGRPLHSGSKGPKKCNFIPLDLFWKYQDTSSRGVTIPNHLLCPTPILVGEFLYRKQENK